MQTRDGTTVYHGPLGRHKSLAELLADKRFSGAKFAKSVAGILKVIIIVLFLVASILFLTAPDVCPKVPAWYMWLYPLANLLTAVLTLLTYLFYMLGVAEDSPDNWVKADLTLTVAEVALTVGVAVATLTSCDSTESRFVYFGPLSLVGSLLVAGSGGALYMLWRAEDEPVVASAAAMGSDRLRSASVHI